VDNISVYTALAAATADDDDDGYTRPTPSVTDVCADAQLGTSGKYNDDI